MPSPGRKESSTEEPTRIQTARPAGPAGLVPLSVSASDHVLFAQAHLYTVVSALIRFMQGSFTKTRKTEFLDLPDSSAMEVPGGSH